MNNKTVNPLIYAFDRIIDAAMEEHLSLSGLGRADSEYQGSYDSLDAALERTDEMRRAVNSHDELLRVVKAFHGYDDLLHREAMPDCADCEAIAKAEGKANGK